MRILVTGGAGFIGSAVIRYCLSKTSYEIVNMDCLTYAANLDNLREAAPNNRYAFEQCDICDPIGVANIFERYEPDAVMHLAAESHVDRSIDGPSIFIETNILGTYTLLQAARIYFDKLSPERRKLFRFHHVSTDEVFGSLGDADLFTEQSAYAPNSPYSASKASSDMLVRAWHRTFGLPVVTSNCSNNYGPYQFPEKLIPVAIMAGFSGTPIPIYGTGSNIRDWLYVEDHAQALMMVLLNGAVGETYNIGGNNELNNVELVRLICKTLDKFLPDSFHLPHEKLITFVTDRPGHDQRYAIDASKIKAKLGWSPTVTVEEGLHRTVNWYLQNGWWLEAIKKRGFGSIRLGAKRQSASNSGTAPPS